MLLFLAIALLLVLLLLALSVAIEAVNPPRCTAGWALARHLPVDPGEIGLRFSSWTLDVADGATLPVWEIPIDEEAKDGLTVILLHGWGRSRIESLGRLRPFQALPPGSVQRILLFDLRGHGDAEDSRTRLGWREEQDVLELVRRCGADRVLLAGHSMGGVIAISAAAADDAAAEPIAGVVAWAPYPDIHVPLRNRLALKNAPTRPVTDLALLLLRAIGVRRASTIAAARRLRCPLLVVEGAADRVSPPESARAIAEAAPRSSYLEVPGADHADLHLVDPATHDAAIARWIQAIAASEADEPGDSGRSQLGFFGGRV